MVGVVVAVVCAGEEEAVVVVAVAVVGEADKLLLGEGKKGALDAQECRVAMAATKAGNAST